MLCHLKIPGSAELVMHRRGKILIVRGTAKSGIGILKANLELNENNNGKRKRKKEKDRRRVC